jgi:hypothetical protein
VFHGDPHFTALQSVIVVDCCVMKIDISDLLSHLCLVNIFSIFNFKLSWKNELDRLNLRYRSDKLIFCFFFIAVLGGGTLWHLQKFS